VREVRAGPAAPQHQHRSLRPDTVAISVFKYLLSLLNDMEDHVPPTTVQRGHSLYRLAQYFRAMHWIVGECNARTEGEVPPFGEMLVDYVHTLARILETLNDHRQDTDWNRCVRVLPYHFCA
jgi:hypothetical protein